MTLGLFLQIVSLLMSVFCFLSFIMWLILLYHSIVVTYFAHQNLWTGMIYNFYAISQMNLSFLKFLFSGTWHSEGKTKQNKTNPKLNIVMGKRNYHNNYLIMLFLHLAFFSHTQKKFFIEVLQCRSQHCWMILVGVQKAVEMSSCKNWA